MLNEFDNPDGTGKVELVIFTPMGKDAYRRERMPYRPLTAEEVGELMREWGIEDSGLVIPIIEDGKHEGYTVTFNKMPVRIRAKGE